jgi:hypothetical protein
VRPSSANLPPLQRDGSVSIKKTYESNKIDIAPNKHYRKWCYGLDLVTVRSSTVDLLAQTASLTQHAD